jgi:hypothetical protein
MLRFCRAPTVIGSIHCELEKVKFPEFFGAPVDAAVEAWLEKMAMCVALRNYTSHMKVRMTVFQLKGSALLGWKTLLPQLNIAVEDVSGNCSRNGSERGIFQRNSLSVNSMSSTFDNRDVVWCSSTRHVLWHYSGKLRTLTLRRLRSSG